ncbi:murein hydrolase activator EnvC family protein [Alkalibacter mobilis]|uniref:murein hydrolase activator EnvC family protein n=1 Tax=Alkalibacter mobilis TaxID=2787712 RepID=UPI00189FDE05|nr:peptidoglycan DD-metalloendopeptidase family protein [Alkalibacter mobilis]MBF7095537.1 peptidoglycan DD-metalloendopeptidase family protein [Alkalibacter mobilis]
MKKKLLVIFLTFAISISMFSSTITASTVEDLQEDLDAIEDKKAETQEKLDLTKASISDVMKEIQKLNDDIAAIEDEIEDLQKDINVIEGKLAVLEAELKAAEEKRIEYKEVLDERIRVMYMFGDSSYLEVLFSAEDFGDLISKIDMIKTVIEYDQTIFAELEAIEQEISAKKDEVEDEKNKIVAKQNEARQKKSSLNKVVVNRESRIGELKSNQRLLEEESKALEQESNKIKTEILSKQNINEKLNSKYLWPVPGVSRISSPYGYRIHPIYGYRKFHSGIDISTQGRRGFDAVAIGFGEVIDSRYSSSYGNMVAIDLGLDENGNRVSAVYAHLAKRYVGVGTKVSPGTSLGEVGTTGLSTGIHLHFEIRINGNTVNPLGYVSP